MAPTAGEILETLFDFADASLASSWESIGDRVMGGVSSGQLVPLAGGRVVFRGEVLLEHGGGFASVRSAPGPFDLSAHEGLLLEARGDGRTYKLSIRTDPWADGVSYQVRFATRPGEDAVHRLPFGDFRPTWRGRPVPGAPLLEPARVCSFGLLVGDRQVGAFHLEIAAIRAYRRRG